MANARRRETVLGAIMLAAGIGYLAMTFQLPRKQFIDAAFVPYILGFALCLLGVFQLRTARRLPSAAPAADQADAVDSATVWKTVGLIVAYIALLEPIGFPIVTVLYLYAQFVVLTPVSRRVNHPGYGTLAVAASAAIFLVFRYGLDLLLPLGILD